MKTGAELASNIRRGTEDSDCEHGDFQCSACCDAMIAREFDAAVAELVGDRDAWKLAAQSAGKAMDNIGAERARLREENAPLKAERDALKARLKADQETIDELTDAHDQRRAALGRAHAALTKMLTSTDSAEGFAETVWAARAAIADHDGKAARDYMAALEREHEAVAICTKVAAAIDDFANSDRKLAHLIEDGEQAGKTLEAAHAAVEALRGGR
jgi:chromosome segregation ATPase